MSNKKPTGTDEKEEEKPYNPQAEKIQFQANLVKGKAKREDPREETKKRFVNQEDEDFKRQLDDAKKGLKKTPRH